MNQQTQMMKDVMGAIFNAFQPKKETYTIVVYAEIEQAMCDVMDRMEFEFEIIEEDGWYRWVHNEYSEPELGDPFQSANEAYDDSYDYAIKQADERSQELQAHYNSFKRRF